MKYSLEPYEHKRDKWCLIVDGRQLVWGDKEYLESLLIGLRRSR